MGLAVPATGQSPLTFAINVVIARSPTVFCEWISPSLSTTESAGLARETSTRVGCHRGVAGVCGTSRRELEFVSLLLLNVAVVVVTASLFCALASRFARNCARILLKQSVREFDFHLLSAVWQLFA